MSTCYFTLKEGTQRSNCKFKGSVWISGIWYPGWAYSGYWVCQLFSPNGNRDTQVLFQSVEGISLSQQKASPLSLTPPLPTAILPILLSLSYLHLDLCHQYLHYYLWVLDRYYLHHLLCLQVLFLLHILLCHHFPTPLLNPTVRKFLPITTPPRLTAQSPPGLFFRTGPSSSQCLWKPAIEPSCLVKPLYWTRIQIIKAQILHEPYGIS